MRLLAEAPYRHWIAGLLFELAVFSLFAVLTVLVSVAIALLLV